MAATTTARRLLLSVSLYSAVSESSDWPRLARLAPRSCVSLASLSNMDEEGSTEPSSEGLPAVAWVSEPPFPPCWCCSISFSGSETCSCSSSLVAIALLMRLTACLARDRLSGSPSAKVRSIRTIASISCTISSIRTSGVSAQTSRAASWAASERSISAVTSSDRSCSASSSLMSARWTSICCAVLTVATCTAGVGSSSVVFSSSPSFLSAEGSHHTVVLATAGGINWRIFSSSWVCAHSRVSRATDWERSPPARAWQAPIIAACRIESSSLLRASVKIGRSCSTGGSHWVSAIASPWTAASCWWMSPCWYTSVSKCINADSEPTPSLSRLPTARQASCAISGTESKQSSSSAPEIRVVSTNSSLAYLPPTPRRRTITGRTSGRTRGCSRTNRRSNFSPSAVGDTWAVASSASIAWVWTVSVRSSSAEYIISAELGCRFNSSSNSSTTVSTQSVIASGRSAALRSAVRRRRTSERSCPNFGPIVACCSCSDGFIGCCSSPNRLISWKGNYVCHLKLIFRFGSITGYKPVNSPSVRAMMRRRNSNSVHWEPGRIKPLRVWLRRVALTGSQMRRLRTRFWPDWPGSFWCCWKPQTKRRQSIAQPAGSG